MFVRLRESKQSAERSFLKTGLGSVAAHAALILGAGLSLRSVSQHRDTVRADTTMVFLAQPQTGPTLEASALLAPARGFKAIPLPSQIPGNVPPVDVGQHFDPRDYSGAGAEGGSADGAVADGRVYGAAGVDEAPLLLSRPPAYPERLQLAGVEGRVLIEGVVDTTGRLEPASIRILQSPTAGFEQTTLQWALKARFRPARVQGSVVRVLVRQPVDFSGAVSGG